MQPGMTVLLDKSSSAFVYCVFPRKTSRSLCRRILDFICFVPAFYSNILYNGDNDEKTVCVEIQHSQVEMYMFRIGFVGLLLSGCTWFDDEVYHAELKNVDDDGDGVTLAEGDCNDNNPNVSPNIEEIWYDGIDANCSGDNDFDNDYDGYVPPEHEGKMTTTYVTDVTILPLPGGYCNDTDPDS